MNNFRIDDDEFQLYLNRIRPMYHQLFNIAYAITGNCDQAEYCMQCVFLNYWVESAGSRHGFREGLRNMLIQLAYRESIAGREKIEIEWDELKNETDDSISTLAARESTEMRRILALKYGCGLSNMRIARLTSIDMAHVQMLLNRFDARARRKLSASDGRRPDVLLTRFIRSNFSAPNPLAPDISNMFRTFEADAASVSMPGHLPGRIIRALLALILALMCICMFWLAAILMQPAVIEDGNPAEAAENVTVYEAD